MVIHWQWLVKALEVIVPCVIALASGLVLWQWCAKRKNVDHIRRSLPPPRRPDSQAGVRASHGGDPFFEPEDSDASLQKIANLEVRLGQARSDANNARENADASKAEAARLAEEADVKRKMMVATEEQLRRGRVQTERLMREGQELDRKWRAGERPINPITTEQIDAARKRYHYQDHLFHVAVAGVAGAGKSSLVNAFCGLRDIDNGAAHTGDPTRDVSRYSGQPPVVWYDFPGAETRNVPSWDYFNQQCLYAFDCIVLVVDNRFMDTDRYILESCRLIEPPIPTFIVRSKSDQQIRNLYDSALGDEDEDEMDDSVKKSLLSSCVAQYVQSTKENIRQNLREVGMDENQKVYLVSRDVTRAVATSREPRSMAVALDERQLYDRITAAVRDSLQRRPRK
jgi:GTP-binding protein EngB required for normal cell division